MTIKDIHQRLSYLEQGRKDIDDIKYDSNTTRTTVKELRKKMSLQKAEIAQQQKIADQNDEWMTNAYNMLEDQMQETTNRDEIQTQANKIMGNDNQHVSLKSMKSLNVKANTSKDLNERMLQISTVDRQWVQGFQENKLKTWKNEKLMKHTFIDLPKILSMNKTFCYSSYRQELNVVTLQLLLWNLILIMFYWECVE